MLDICQFVSLVVRVDFLDRRVLLQAELYCLLKGQLLCCIGSKADHEHTYRMTRQDRSMSGHGQYAIF